MPAKASRVGWLRLSPGPPLWLSQSYLGSGCQTPASDYLLSGLGMGVMIKIIVETANNTAM